MEWQEIGHVDKFTAGTGGCVKIKEKQIAVFSFDNKSKWYAVQNLCPHDNRMVLSRGIIGSEGDEPKVACPLHKHAFSLQTGKHLSEGEVSDIATYEIKEENKILSIKL
jgi:nitrite reductase (NADH) small subunit